MLMSPIKDETAVHGCHCPGDTTVGIRGVMAMPRVGVRVCHLLHLLRDISYSAGRKSAHCLIILMIILRYFYQTTKPTFMVSFRSFGTRSLLVR